MEPQSVSQLIDVLQGKDDSPAQTELWRRYYDDLIVRVGRRLGRRHSIAEDEEDVALGAMDSFFRGMKDGRYPELRNRGAFWNLLLTIAYRKASKLRKKENALKRGGGTVQNFTSVAAASDDGVPLDVALEADPTEEEIAVAVEEMTEGLGDDVLRTIALRRLQGYTDKEIARKLGVAERTVIRKRRRIQAIWQSELDE